MKKEDFEKVPARGGFSRDVGEFDALVIIPQDYAHDSGWMCKEEAITEWNEVGGGYIFTHFCPFCGAKMDGGNEDATN